MSNNPYENGKKKPRGGKKEEDNKPKTLEELTGQEEQEAAQKEVAGAAEVLETPEVSEKPSLSVVTPKTQNSAVPPLDKNTDGKKPAKEPVHIFFDPDIKKMILKKQKEKGKGWKSNYVNDLVRWAFEQEGWIEPKE